MEEDAINETLSEGQNFRAGGRAGEKWVSGSVGPEIAGTSSSGPVAQWADYSYCQVLCTLKSRKKIT